MPVGALTNSLQLSSSIRGKNIVLSISVGNAEMPKSKAKDKKQRIQQTGDDFLATVEAIIEADQETPRTEQKIEEKRSSSSVTKLTLLLADTLYIPNYKVFYHDRVDCVETDKAARRRATLSSEQWQEQNKDAIHKLKDHFGDNFKILTWSELEQNSTFQSELETVTGLMSQKGPVYNAALESANYHFGAYRELRQKEGKDRLSDQEEKICKELLMEFSRREGAGVLVMAKNMGFDLNIYPGTHTVNVRSVLDTLPKTLERMKPVEVLKREKPEVLDMSRLGDSIKAHQQQGQQTKFAVAAKPKKPQSPPMGPTAIREAAFVLADIYDDPRKVGLALSGYMEGMNKNRSRTPSPDAKDEHKLLLPVGATQAASASGPSRQQSQSKFFKVASAATGVGAGVGVGVGAGVAAAQASTHVKKPSNGTEMVLGTSPDSQDSQDSMSSLDSQGSSSSQRSDASVDFDSAKAKAAASASSPAPAEFRF